MKNNYIKSIMLSIVLVLFLPINAFADRVTITISDSIGGVLKDYAFKALTYEQIKATVVFDGQCLSSCTILTSNYFNNPKCMTPNAIFGFHEPYMDKDKSQLTEQDLELLKKAKSFMWHSYHPKIQRFLLINGWPSHMNGDPVNKLTLMTASDLEGVIPYCE